MYRAIVEHGFSEFQGALSLKGEMRERVEKMREKRVIYLLVLPEAKKTQASEQILRKMISYVSDAEPKVDVLYV